VTDGNTASPVGYMDEVPMSMVPAAV